MARKKASLGCLFWTALVLLVIVIFLFNRTAIEGVLERTDLIGVLQRTVSGGHAPVDLLEDPVLDPPSTSSEPNGALQAPAAADGSTDVNLAPERGNGSDEQTVVQVSPDAEATDTPPEPSSAPAAEAPGTEAVVTADSRRSESATEGRRERRARLYFVTVDDGGTMSLHGLSRTIAYEDAPLTATLTELLSGPASVELQQGYISLIPPGVELRRVAVQNSVAVIDFSEQFRFNRLGQEGLSAQLQQIVYSATEFPTVSAVQILIDGKRVDYLGPEACS